MSKINKIHARIAEINFILIAAIVVGSAVFISQYTNPATEIKFYYVAVLNVIAAIFTLIQLFIFRENEKSMFGGLVFIILVYFLFTVFKSDYKQSALKGFITFLTFALLYFNFSVNINNDKKIRTLLSLISFTTAAICLYGLLQFAGYDFYKWGRVYELFEDMDVLRVISSFGNPNFLGAYITVVYPLILALNCIKFRNNIYIFSSLSISLLFIIPFFKIDFFYFDDKKSLNVELLFGLIALITAALIYFIAKMLKKQRFDKLINNYLLPLSNKILLALIIITLCFTYNRGAYIAVIIQTAIFFLFQKFFFKKKLFTKKNLAGIVLLFLIFLTVVFLSTDLKNKIILGYKRIVNISNTKQEDVRIRFYLWQTALNAARNNIIAGSGIGTFMHVFPSEITENWKKIFPSPDMIVESAHSEFFEVLIETGIIGLTLIMLLFIRIFYTAYFLLKLSKNKNEFYSYLLIVIISAFAGIIIHALFESKVRYVSTIVPLIVYTAALEFIAYKIKEKKNISIKKEISQYQQFQIPLIILMTFSLIILVLLYLKPLASNIYTNFGLIELRYSQNNLDAPLNLFNKALELDKDNEIALYTKARVLAHSQNHIEFDETANRLLLISPYFKDINSIYGEALNRRGLYNPAKYYIKRNLTVSAPKDVYYLFQVSEAMRERNYSFAEKIILTNYDKFENQAYIDFLLGRISDIRGNYSESSRYYKSSITKSPNNSVNYFNLAITLFKNNNINHGLMYLYLAKLVDLQANTITRAQWTDVLTKLNSTLILSPEISQYSKLFYIKLKLFTGITADIETEISMLKNELTVKPLIDELNIIREQIAFFKNNGFEEKTFSRLLDDMSAPPELIELLLKQIISNNQLRQYSKKIMEYILQNNREDVYNIYLLNSVLAKFQQAGLNDNTAIINNLLKNKKPASTVFDKFFNAFGIMGFDFSYKTLIVDKEYELTFNIINEQKIPLKIRVFSEISDKNQIVRVSQNKYIDLNEFSAGEVRKFNLKIIIPRDLQAGEYDLKLKYQIITDKQIDFSEIIANAKSENKVYFTKINVSEDKNVLIELAAEKDYNNASYQKAYNKVFTELPDSYKSDNLKFQFLKLKLLMLLEKKSEAAEYIQKCRKLFNEQGAAYIIEKYGHTFVYERLNYYLDYLALLSADNFPKITMFEYFKIIGNIIFYPSSLNSRYYNEVSKKMQIYGSEENPSFFYTCNDSMIFDGQESFFSEHWNITANEFNSNDFGAIEFLFINRPYWKFLNSGTVKNFVKNILDFHIKKTALFQNNILFYMPENAEKFAVYLIEAGEYIEAFKFLEMLSAYPRNMDISKIRYYLFHTSLLMNDFDKADKYIKMLAEYRATSKTAENYYFTAKFLREKIDKGRKLQALGKQFDFSKSDSKENIYDFEVVEKKYSIDNNFVKLSLTLKSDRIAQPRNINIGYINEIGEFIKLDEFVIHREIMPKEVINLTKTLFVDGELFKKIETAKINLILETASFSNGKINRWLAF